MIKSIPVCEKELKKLRRSDAIVQALESSGNGSYKLYYAQILKDIFNQDEIDKLIEYITDCILDVCSEEGDVEYPAGRECGHNILLGDAYEPVEQLLAKLVASVRAIDAEYK